jgi:2-polyprenyl-6-methoxyphenol hydroxylase-like FAD-dependent oxidoreductase
MLPILIAGGGIGGLTLALTLQQIGLPFLVLESAQDMKSRGVGITLQPNAVRELFDLGIGPKQLNLIGNPITTWMLAAQDGTQIHSEPRGLEAGYNWPQYAVHRGALHLTLYQELKRRCPAGSLRLGQNVTGYRNNDDGTVTATVCTATGPRDYQGCLLIGAEGVHSAVRSQMFPDQTELRWGGSMMWRGTVKARAQYGAETYFAQGSAEHRLVLYPISAPNPGTGCVTLNWIVEKQIDPVGGWEKTGWFRPASASDFAPVFDDFHFDDQDLRNMLQHAPVAYETPLLDRDPLPSWVDGPVALLGDAAHVMYPTGSNGATQAIVDARTLGAMMLQHGATPRALKGYCDKLHQPMTDLILRNRASGPLALLDIAKTRCQGNWSKLDQMMPPEERQSYLSDYKRAAGYDVGTLNSSPSTIPSGVRQRQKAIN